MRNDWVCGTLPLFKKQKSLIVPDDFELAIMAHKYNL
jgi:hypothetical protein